MHSVLVIVDRISKNTQVSDFIKIRSVGAEMFDADGRTDGRRDGHDEENSRCSQYDVLTAVLLKMHAVWNVVGLICSPIPTLTPKTQG
jgi:hypothetical protein